MGLENILNPSGSQPDQPSQTPQRRGKEVSIGHRYMAYALRVHAGWTIRRIARTLHIPNTTIHRLTYKARQGTFKFKADKRSGRPKIITPPLRQKLVTIVTACSHNRRLPFASLANLVGIRVSRDTIRQALQEDGFNRRVARQKPFLTDQAKQRRYNFALLHAHWGVEEWRRVIWTDECAFNVGGAYGRIWVTRRPGEEYLQDCIVPKFRKLSLVMVWGAISGIGGKLSLVFWDKKEWGNINGASYRDRILLPHLIPLYRRERLFWGSPLVAMEDNTPAHNAIVAKEARNTHLLPSLPWPSCSPDLNPIEEIWHRMKNEISALPERPSTIQTMEDAIWSIWAKIDQASIQAIVDTMPARIEAVLSARGGHTRY